MVSVHGFELFLVVVSSDVEGGAFLSHDVLLFFNWFGVACGGLRWNLAVRCELMVICDVCGELRFDVNC